MDQSTQTAPFNVGDHVRYVGAQQRAVPAGAGKSEVVMVWGMAGVVIASSGPLPGQQTSAARPWRCQVQFRNGFQVDLTPDNRADFDVAH